MHILSYSAQTNIRFKKEKKPRFHSFKHPPTASVKPSVCKNSTDQPKQRSGIFYANARADFMCKQEARTLL